MRFLIFFLIFASCVSSQKIVDKNNLYNNPKAIQDLNVKVGNQSASINDAINVNSFGIIGDGLKDNTSLLQKIINWAGLNKKKIYFPNGIYLTNQLLIPSNTKILGQNREKTILKLVSGSDNKNLGYIHNEGVNINFSNITLDANFSNNTGKSLSALYILNDHQPASPINNINLSNVSFKGGKGTGTLTIIGYSQKISNININNCNFDSSGSNSVQLRGCKTVNVNNCKFTNWGLSNPNVSSFNFLSIVNENIILKNNVFKNTNGHQFAIECAGAEVINSSFSDNIFYGNFLGASGISGAFTNSNFSNNKHLEGSGSWRSGYEIFGNNDIIANNFIENGSITLFGKERSGDYIGSFGNGFTVTNNIVKTNSINTSSLFIAGESQQYPVKNAKIIGNTFDNSASRGSNSPTIHVGTYGGEFYADSLFFEKNIIVSSSTQSCVYIRGADTLHNLVFKSNIFKGYSGFRFLNPDKLVDIQLNNNDFSEISNESNIFTYDTATITRQFKVLGNKYKNKIISNN